MIQGRSPTSAAPWMQGSYTVKLSCTRDFDGDGRIDLYTTGTYTQWGFLHEYPGLPVPLPGRIFKPIAVSWMEKMCRGNSLLLQTPKGRFEDATARSGAQRNS